MLVRLFEQKDHNVLVVTKFPASLQKDEHNMKPRQQTHTTIDALLKRNAETKGNLFGPSLLLLNGAPAIELCLFRRRIQNGDPDFQLHVVEVQRQGLVVGAVVFVADGR